MEHKQLNTSKINKYNHETTISPCSFINSYKDIFSPYTVKQLKNY